MRKHFLILMLLALLPLSGWAANVVVTIGNINKAYKDPNPPVTTTMFAVTAGNVAESTLKDYLTIERIQTGEEVGQTYTFTLTYNGNLDGVDNVICSNEGRMTIVKKDLSTLNANTDIEITGSTAIQQSTGKAEPAVKVTVNGEVLTLDEDYTVAYGDNNQAGQDGTITIAAATNSTKFKGSKQKTFTVKNGINGVVFNYVNGTSANDDLVYDGTAKTITLGNIVATLDNDSFGDFDIVATGYSNNINQGTATATVKGTGNYDGTATVEFTITKRNITLNAKNGKRSYGEPSTKIVEATQNAGLVNVAAGTLAENQTVVPVIATSVAQTAAPADNAGAITLNNSTTKILDANDNDVTSNYNITWNTATAQLKIERQSLQSEDVELSFTPTKVYDGTDAIPTYTLTDKNLNKALVEKNNTNDNDFTVTLSNEADTKNAGTYTIQFSGNGNYTGNAYNAAQTVTITAKPINIKVNDLSVGMGTLPQFTLDQSYTADVIGQDDLGLANIAYTIKDNNNQEVLPANLTPGTYSVVASGLTNTNYDYNYVAGELTVTAGSILAVVTVNNGTPLTFGEKIAADGITIKHFEGLAEGTAVTAFNNGVVTTGVEYKIYNKATGLEAQTVKKTVLDNNVETEVDLGFYPAGTYIVKKVAGTPTYQTYNITVLDGEFTINPFNLSTNTGDKVAIAALSRRYTGTAVAPTTTGKITFQYGNQNTDILTLAEGTDYSVALLPSEGTGNNLVEYDNINVSGTHMVTISAVDNGNFTGSQKKEFTINKAPLTITADPKTWYYGTTATQFNATVGAEDASLVGQDANLDLAALTPAQAVTAGFAGTLKVRNTQTTTEGIHENALQAYFEDTNGEIVELTANDAAANYEINRVNGNYTIAKSEIYLKVKDVTKVYGTAFAADGFVLDEENTDLEKYPLTDVYKNNITTFLNDVDIQVADFDEADGKYRVGKNYAITGTATSTNFVIKGIANGTFTLTPYAITVKTENQAVNLSQDQSFNKVASVDNTVTITSGALQNGDLIGAVVASLSATQNVGENTISIVSAENADYTLTPVNTGILTITGAPAIVLGNNAETDAATIVQYAASENQVNVKLNMNNRVMKYVDAETGADGTIFEWQAQKWFALVLPFEISVADLSKAFGYAVVNRLSSVSETPVPAGGFKAEANFSLEMGTIPANEPFLLKTTKKVTEINANVQNEEAGVINFGAQKIEAPTDIIVENIPCPSVSKNGYTFYGTYVDKTVTKDQTKWSYLINGEWRKLGTTSQNKYIISPFNAYFDRGEANAREIVFNMEEIDGSTTSIKCLSADNVLVNNAEGWYTVDGIKLQNAPTQKGIYINNGKKVVLK